MIVLDTNALSETLKPSPSQIVLGWLAAQAPREVFITTITQAEVLYGIESLPAGKRKAHLAASVERVFVERFPGRILAFHEEAARLYAKIVRQRDVVGRPISPLDAMIAAIARSQNASVATRNTRDFEGCGVRVINPWNENQN
jgi:predicted nucleic acid-binding protein